MKRLIWMASLLLVVGKTGVLAADTVTQGYSDVDQWAPAIPSRTDLSQSTASAVSGGPQSFAQLTGVVTKVDDSTRSLKVRADDGKSYQFYASANVPIYNAQNQAQEFHNLQPNDRVQVRYDANNMRAQEITDIQGVSDGRPSSPASEPSMGAE